MDKVRGQILREGVLYLIEPVPVARTMARTELTKSMDTSTKVDLEDLAVVVVGRGLAPHHHTLTRRADRLVRFAVVAHGQVVADGVVIVLADRDHRPTRRLCCGRDRWWWGLVA